MKALMVGLIVIVLGFAVYSLINSRKYKFYYFPETNMYYDVKKRQYIYSIDGGKTWALMTRSTKEIPELLGEKVIIKSKDPNVWLLNPEHRREYNGVLTDINAALEHRNNYSVKSNKKPSIETNEHPRKDSAPNKNNESLKEDSTPTQNMLVEGENIFQRKMENTIDDSEADKPINKGVKPGRKKDTLNKEQDTVELEGPDLFH